MLIVNKFLLMQAAKPSGRVDELFAFTTPTLYNDFDKYG